MMRASEDNTPPDVPHAPGTDTDPHRGEVSEARPDLLRRLLDILGWESGTEEQALEALADAVRVARGGRMGKDVHLQRNEARAECERLRREYAQLRREHMDLIDADIVLIRRHAAREEELRALRNPPDPAEGPEGGAR